MLRLEKNKYLYHHFLRVKSFPVVVLLIMLFDCQITIAQRRTAHNHLLLSSWGIKEIKQNRNNLLIKRALDKIQNEVDEAMRLGIRVPEPEGKGAGYSHDQNKKNGYYIYDAGLLYQVTGEKKYAEFAEKLLLKFAAMYPTLGLHPNHSKKSPGKLFWQALNSTVWLVYAIQGYDFLYNYFTPAVRNKIETHLFLPMATFLSVDSPYNFDRIHNHGTWAVTAVGMTGYVLGKKNMVEESLFGLKKNGKGGFYAQIDHLFSPDGYYVEGPYYQRYATLPFLTFADAIHNYDPARKIFAYRDSVLIKSVGTLLQMTSPTGAFFPFNDDMKDKTWLSPEILLGVDVAYAYGGKNPELLDVAQKQKMVTLTDAGVITALDWAKGRAKPFYRHSVFLSDGPKGHKGGIGILRYGQGKPQTTLVMKATSHGMGHGHFDELDMLVYDNGGELIRDYGSVRFLNIEAKDGGRYLPQNTTWAKQTIASNSPVVNETSQYSGKLKLASSPTSHPEFLAYSSSDSNFQYMSALDTTAYPGVKLTRTMILSKLPDLKHPIIIDVINIKSAKNNQYDIPFYYKGQLIGENFPINAFTTCLKPLGKNYGYQYLWLNGIGKSKGNIAQITWLNKNRFYTLTSLTNRHSRILFTTIGASDPHFNLRNEHGLIFRQSNTGNHVFVNIIDSHGVFNATDEFTTGSQSQISGVSLIKKNKSEINLKLSFKNGSVWEYNVPTNPMNGNKTKFRYQQIEK